MATSRYAYSKVVTIVDEYNPRDIARRLSTWGSVKSTDISSPDDIRYELKSSDRLDHVAYNYLGDGRYWWMICLANDLVSPFDKTLRPGRILTIPSNPERVLNVLKAKINRKN